MFQEAEADLPVLITVAAVYERASAVDIIEITEEPMKEECLICKAPLEYLNEDIEMECELCHKKEKSKTRCINGHYVCN